jgi:hypothetical protein
MIRRAQRPDTGYTTLSNEPPNDPDLSFAAKGLLWYLLSKPEDWEAKMITLFDASTDGQHATRSAFKELETAGYVQRLKTYDPRTGKFAYDYIVFDSPSQGDQVAVKAQEFKPPTHGTQAIRPSPLPASPRRGEATKLRGGPYDFSKGLPESVQDFLRRPECRWHWGEDLETYCYGREMGDPSAYMLGVLKKWLRGDPGRPRDRERETTTTPKVDVNAERRKRQLTGVKL